MKARTGKIARLPRHIREELNVRMVDGESGKSLVAWLNTLPEVREVLARDFAGRPILEQNLSEWRRGGHREWCAQRELTAELSLQAGRDADASTMTGRRLSDRLSDVLTTRYASLVAATSRVTDWTKPRHRAALRELCEEVAIIRRLDHSAARLSLEVDLLETRKAGLKLEQEAQIKRTDAEWRQWTIKTMNEMVSLSKTPEEALHRLLILLHGHTDEELIAEDRHRLHEKAGTPPHSRRCHVARRHGLPHEIKNTNG